MTPSSSIARIASRYSSVASWSSAIGREDTLSACPSPLPSEHVVAVRLRRARCRPRRARRGLSTRAVGLRGHRARTRRSRGRPRRELRSRGPAGRSRQPSTAPVDSRADHGGAARTARHRSATTRASRPHPHGRSLRRVPAEPDRTRAAGCRRRCRCASRCDMAGEPVANGARRTHTFWHVRRICARRSARR